MSERHMVKTSLSPITHIESHQYIPKITAVNDTAAAFLHPRPDSDSSIFYAERDNDFLR